MIILGILIMCIVLLMSHTGASLLSLKNVHLLTVTFLDKAFFKLSCALLYFLYLSICCFLKQCLVAMCDFYNITCMSENDSLLTS